MSGYTVAIVAVVCVAIGLLGWFVTPKGPQQTHVPAPEMAETIILTHNPLD